MSKSIANGDELSAETWADFVGRLRHDCVGDGVRDHCTADAIFIVQARRDVYGIDPDYADRMVICFDDSEWESPKAYWDDASEDERTSLDDAAQDLAEVPFLSLDRSDQHAVLDDIDGHYIVGVTEKWAYVSAHFTKDAAEAFIRRKAHDYRKGLRVYVEAQCYSWEYNTIKKAILNGSLTFTAKDAA